MLDLDNTLIHSDWTRGRGWRTFKRPGAEDFLRQVHCIHICMHSFIARLPIRRSGALQQTFYGSPAACPVLGFPPLCN